MGPEVEQGVPAERPHGQRHQEGQQRAEEAAAQQRDEDDGQGGGQADEGDGQEPPAQCCEAGEMGTAGTGGCRTQGWGCRMGVLGDAGMGTPGLGMWGAGNLGMGDAGGGHSGMQEWSMQGWGGREWGHGDQMLEESRDGNEGTRDLES